MIVLLDRKNRRQSGELEGCMQVQRWHRGRIFAEGTAASCRLSARKARAWAEVECGSVSAAATDQQASIRLWFD